MSHVLLIVAGLTTGQPPVVPELKPAELPADLRKQVLDMTGRIKADWKCDYSVCRDGFTNRADQSAARAELAACERWMLLRPGDQALRVRAISLAGSSCELDICRRHGAELRREIGRLLAANPALIADRRVLSALRYVDDKPTGLVMVRQAVRLAPRSADAWRTLGLLLAVTNADRAEWRAAFTQAARLAPHDWRVLADQLTARQYRFGGPLDLLAIETELREADRLGGADPECRRWVEETYNHLYHMRWSVSDPPSAPRRGLDEWLPAIIRMVEAHPGDARAVTYAFAQEVRLRNAAGEVATGQEMSSALELLTPEVRGRYERWVRQVLWSATLPGPDAADRLDATCYLLTLVGRRARAAEALALSLEQRPGHADRERMLRVLLWAADRPAAGLERCRRDGGDRTPAGVRFEVICLLQLGRLAEARGLAEVALAAAPAELAHKLTLARCRLREDTPEGRAVADGLLAEVWAAVQSHPPTDPQVKETGLLLVVAHLLAGRYLEADRLLDRFGNSGQPFARHELLTKAARPYRWVFGAKNDSFVVPAAVR